MPLNRLENFIKNIEGRILYVNPNDLDSTDSINNDGNSLAQPFKTIQRALIEAARFSYLTGKNNDYVERTTILVYPGEHPIDNRPGFALKKDPSAPTTAKVVAPGGGESSAQDTLSLNLTSNFDIDQKDNILYKFNSIHGGVIVPRGTSIVGLDLRKTKVKPKYVPNPIDPDVPYSAIFRLTGACYFWQFSLFDGQDKVYTSNTSFDGVNDTSVPTFSHHKLTCFEYADGVNIAEGYELTDLDMYYAKLSNAFNEAADTKVIPDSEKYPINPDGFAKRRPEFEIVGAFAEDPINISDIYSGDGRTPSPLITVTTEKPHGLNQGTPIKIKNVTKAPATALAYNSSSVVQQVLSATQFTYLIYGSTSGLPASVQYEGIDVSNATVTVETDTVDGASPYIFNCSLRSVYGMNGMNADGSKATGFRSMVVAQFTGISLQKDDRAFVKYNKQTRAYDGVSLSTIVYGSELSAQSAQADASQVYHLDSDAIYRQGWETAHVKITNDAILQIVSVFAIGFNRHFCAESGGDASITNSNSNFGQLSLSSDGFKKEAFDKDNTALITQIITPKSIPDTYSGDTNKIAWYEIDTVKTAAVGISSHLYLYNWDNEDEKPTSVVAGYKIGANLNDTLYVPLGKVGSYVKGSVTGFTTETAEIRMTDSANGAVSTGSSISVKRYKVTVGPVNSVLTIGAHGIQNGESIRIFSDDADLPENVEDHKLYYCIDKGDNNTIELAASLSDALNGTKVTIYGGTNLWIESRVHDKDSGDLGSPIQFNSSQHTFTRRVARDNGEIVSQSVTETAGWYVHTEPGSQASNYEGSPAYKNIKAGTTTIPEPPGVSKISYIRRTEDSRSLDDKIYKMRVVVPKEVKNGKNPEEGFIIQESSTTGYRDNNDPTKTSITSEDWNYDRNPRFISTCSVSSNLVTVVSELPHNLQVDDKVTIKSVTSTSNIAGAGNSGYNGSYSVTEIIDSTTFKHSTTDVEGVIHNVGTFTNDVTTRTTDTPRFEVSDIKNNYYVYRNETITPYIEDIQDGIYHLFVVNAGNKVPVEFTAEDVSQRTKTLKYSQNVEDLYPQLDRDNSDDNPDASKSFAKRSPLGDVSTNYLKDSITRETTDEFLKDFGYGHLISSVVDNGTTADITFDRGHNFDGIVEGVITPGSNQPNGTYRNVKLLQNNPDPAVNPSANWYGATANVVIAGGAVTSVEILDPGGGYSSLGNSTSLYFDNTRFVNSGGTTARYTITKTGTDRGIADSSGLVVQVTGDGTTNDGYYRILSVSNNKTIKVTKNAADHSPVIGQYVYAVAPSVTISSISGDWTQDNKLITINTSSAHGLVAGNSFRVIKNSDDSNLGDYVVNERIDYDTFTVKTGTDIRTTAASGKIYKLGMGANNARSDKDGENIGSRGLSIYGNEYLTLKEDITPSDTAFKVLLPNSGIGTMTRFPLGTYIQIDNEIMRISASTLGGSSGDEITVIRGVLGTLIPNADSNGYSHLENAIIKKIEPISIEFRRPSILRASGHTFEYVGYGPGNYSTGLPQVQVKSLSEREEFLVQSQERSCGAVVYTGMNNRGDFYIGNKRVSSATGQEKTFDAPVPTITGEDPSSLSVIFDEVVVKQRILVEGGASNKVQSQFDGPVTFNADVQMNGNLNVLGNQTVDGDTIMNGTVKYEGGLEVDSKLQLSDNALMTLGDNKDAFFVHDTNQIVGAGISHTFIGLTKQEPAAGDFKIVREFDINNKTDYDTVIDVYRDPSANAGFAVSVTGNIDVDGTVVDNGATHDGDVNFTGDSYNALWDKSTDSLHFNDNAEATFGNTSADPDLEIYANGTNSVIHHTLNSGKLEIKSNKSIDLNSYGFTAIRAVGDAVSAATLYFNGGERLTTNAAGVNITGELTCTGDITALTSDIRLKTDIESIDSPLDKVCKISGFTYKHNETAKVECNIDTGDQRFVGVSAQDVQQVLPEAVKPAPSNDNYLTVQYEKLVPLLIEAIKELKDEVDELKRGK